VYNSLRGRISELGADYCAIDVGGVEYLLTLSAAAVGTVSLNQECRILVYLHHKEDQLKLFGFADKAEREIFLQLLKVSGVGPSLGMKIISGIPGGELRTAIEGGDVSRLSAIPGLGKKSAQKIILALQGSLVPQESGSPGPEAELAEALVAMGFERSAALKALRQVAELHKGESTPGEELLIREAIVALSKGGAG